MVRRRAEAADERRRELGAPTAQDAPAWAVQALGPVSDDGPARVNWEARAGWAAAWRDLPGDDLHDGGRRPDDRADTPAVDDRADLRDRTTPNPHEHADRVRRRRVLPLDETAAAVGRAQDVLTEIPPARPPTPSVLPARPKKPRADELARWAGDDNVDHRDDDRGDQLDEADTRYSGNGSRG